jgi:endoglucanase
VLIDFYCEKFEIDSKFLFHHLPSARYIPPSVLGPFSCGGNMSVILRSWKPWLVLAFLAVLEFTLIKPPTKANASDVASADAAILSTAVVATGTPTVPPVSKHHSSDEIKVCQVGYLPNETKFAMITTRPSGDVIVRKSDDDSAVLTVTAGAPTRDPLSGDSIANVDFSKLSTPGEYYLDVPGVGKSYEFQIADDVFNHAFRLGMRFYTGQRCGTAVSLAPDFPQFLHPACHDELAQFHVSSGKSGTIDCTGGWHDAGDFGRYVVNSGITTGTLLWAFELNSDKLKNVNLNIPESGGKIPDMLAECKWNIDWMLKMQDPADGGVWHKASSEQFCGFISPQNDKLPVYIIGVGEAPFKTTASTADFASVCAIAGRVFAPYDKAYADKCLAAAEKAWGWLQKTPDVPFNNPPGVATGGYGDATLFDERIWASAELFRTTGKSEYNDYFLKNLAHYPQALDAASAQDWGNVWNMAVYTYALSNRPEADQKAVAKIKADAVTAADGIVARSQTDGYRTPMAAKDYIWGSNAVDGNYAMMLLIANRFTPKAAYVNSALDALDYLLGRNTFNESFVTWLGYKWPMHPHHRTSAADGVEQPWPGMVVGGPNSTSGPLASGGGARGGRRGGRRGNAPASTGPGRPTPAIPAAQPQRLPPAKTWEDVEGDYYVNEVAINWNAPFVFILADVMK